MVQGGSGANALSKALRPTTHRLSAADARLLEESLRFGVNRLFAGDTAPVADDAATADTAGAAAEPAAAGASGKAAGAAADVKDEPSADLSLIHI